MTHSVRLVALASCEETDISAHGNPDTYPMHYPEVDRFTALSAAVVSGLLSELAPCDNASTGLVLGTVYGPLDASFRCVEHLEAGKKPSSFCCNAFHSVAAIHLVRFFKIGGPSVTVTLRTWPFVEALRIAMMMLWSRRVEKMIVVGADVTSQVLDRAVGELAPCDRRKYDTGSAGGAIAWMLDAGHDVVNDRDVWLRRADIKECKCDSAFYLLRSGESWVTVLDDRQVSELSGSGSFSPASYLLALNKSAETVMSGAAHGKCMQWIATAGFGSGFVELAVGSSLAS
jgi:hypothetical protein